MCSRTRHNVSCGPLGRAGGKSGMAKRPLAVIVWLGVGLAVVGFCLPWARIDVRATGVLTRLQGAASRDDLFGGIADRLGRVTVTVRRGGEAVTGDLGFLSELPRQVSGAQIPRLANQEQVKAAMALFEVFGVAPARLGLRSYAVYGVPAAALLCGLLLIVAGDRAAVAWGVAAGCAAAAGVGWWKLITLKADAAPIAVTIGSGLWLSVWAYALLAVAASLCALRAEAKS